MPAETLEKLIEEWRRTVLRHPDGEDADGLIRAADDLTAYLSACAYKPGLPSVEEVREHEKRGGWWQAQRPKGLQMLHLSIRRYGGIDMIFAKTTQDEFGPMEADYYSKSGLRPCTPDGWPCPRTTLADSKSAVPEGKGEPR